MSKPILYILPYSSPNRGVVMVAREIGLDLDIKPVDVSKGENKTPEFLQMNPQHTLPTLDDHGAYVWDSHAISTYLIGKYGKSDDHPLYPKDLHTRARIDQRLHFDGGVIFAALGQLVRPIFYDGATEYSEKAIAGGYDTFDFLESFLADGPYLVGANLTVADILIHPSVVILAILVPIDGDKYPKVTKWLQRIESELPYYDEVNTDGLNQFRTIISTFIAKNKAAKQ